MFRFLLLLASSTAMVLNPIDTFLNQMKEYYHGYPILHDSWSHRHHQEGMLRLAERMRKKKFVIGVIGSSVAAGHDNCNYDSYEKQLERILKPIFAYYDKDVEVRNAGEGGGCGDSYRNQIWCVRNLVGDDVDSIHYSWSYFEAGGKDIAKWHEMFIRWSLLMNNAPVPFIMNVGEGRAQDHLFQHYKKFGFNTFFLQKGLKKHFPHYKKEWGVVGNGLHNSTRYGAEGVMWRNWHPGPLGFEIVADGMAVVYLKALKLSMTEPSRPNLMRLLSQNDLPEPLFCDKKWCGSQEPPGCVNFEQPTYGDPQIRIVTPETDDLMPYKTLYNENTQDWEFNINSKSTLIPRQDRNKPECQHFDRCAGYMSREDSWLTFRLPRMEKGQIFVCCTNGKQCGDKMINFDFVLDGHQLDHHSIKKEFGKCVQILDGFDMDMNDSSGHLYLAIKGNEQNIRLSHIITL